MNRSFRIAFVFLLACTFGQAQRQNSSAFADAKMYDAVLDRLFQHDVQPGSPEIQLRYTYCDAGEMQVVVHKLKDSEFRLDVWYLPPGASNVWNQLAQLANSNQTLNAEAAAASIRMSRKTVIAHVSTALAKLLGEASLLSMPLLNQNTITLDGMAYGVAVRSISEDMSLSLQGPQHSEESNSHLIRWMGKVRFSIETELKEH